MPEQANKFLIPIAILIAGGLIVWGIISTNKKTDLVVEDTSQTDFSQPSKETINQPINIWQTDYILGNPDADLIFISFSDFECSFCKIFHQTMHQIINEYGKDGKVAWIFRQFPIYGVAAEKKAVAAECAGQLGGNTKFWEMSDKIFQTSISKDKQTTAEQLAELALSINLDKEKFLKCLDDDIVLNLVKKEYQSGIATGALGTPTAPGGTPHTVILTKMGKTYPINGAQTYNVVKSIIDLILQE